MKQCCGNIVADANVSQFSRAGNVFCGNKLCCWEQKLFLSEVKNIFAFRTQILLSKHMFPSLATMKTMLTRFKCCSLKMFPSNGKQTTMADGEVEVGENGKKERKLEIRGERVTHCFVCGK